MLIALAMQLSAISLLAESVAMCDDDVRLQVGVCLSAFDVSTQHQAP